MPSLWSAVTTAPRRGRLPTILASGDPSATSRCSGEAGFLQLQHRVLPGKLDWLAR